MITLDKQSILFDDLTILKQLVGRHELKASVPNSNCDCAGYAEPLDDEDIDTDQIAPAPDQTY